MYKVYEYSKDHRGNFVTDSKNAPFKWFMINRPRATNLKKKDIVYCLETFEKGKRKYITGLLKLNFKSCYVGDIQDNTVLVWFKYDRIQMIVFENTRRLKLHQRISNANRFLESLLK